MAAAVDLKVAVQAFWTQFAAAGAAVVADWGGPGGPWPEAGTDAAMLAALQLDEAGAAAGPDGWAVLDTPWRGGVCEGLWDQLPRPLQ